MDFVVKNTITLLEEIPTYGHSPLKFLCDDYEIYYCKYRSGISLNQQEIDCLFYELLCHFLLLKLTIPTPELVLVNINQGSFKKEQLNYDKKYCKAGALFKKNGSTGMGQAD